MARNNFSIVNFGRIFAQIVDEIKEVAEAKVVSVANGVVTVIGDFTKFVFTDNPANHLDKYLDITFGGETYRFQSCELLADGNIQFEASAELPLSVDDIILVKEASPFYFETTVNSLNLLDYATPLILISSSEKTKAFSAAALAYNDEYSFTMFIGDMAIDQQDTGSYASINEGNMLSLIRENQKDDLEVYLNRILTKLNQYDYYAANVHATIENVTEDTKVRWVEGLMIKTNTGDTIQTDKNLHGWFCNLSLTVKNSSCITV